MNKRKIIIAVIIFTVVLTFLNLQTIRKFMKDNLPSEVKTFAKELFFGKNYINRIKLLEISHYNEKFLPKTEFENITLEKKIVDTLLKSEEIHYNKVKNTNIVTRKFYIENIKDNLLIVGLDGRIKYIDNLKFKESKNIPSNLHDFKILSILDVELINDELFISLSSRENQDSDCSYFHLVKSKFDYNKLIFNNFFQTEKCLVNILGGRIHYFNNNGTEGIILSTGASDEERDLAQDDKSPYGKMLFFSLDGNEYKIFSKGHRNPQGLTINNGIILSTEHGPYGGDEINKISFGKNYGFPISSYGEDYSFFDEILKSRSNYVFKKSHAKYNFEEPIFTFIPAIGISEIIRVPDSFSKYWINNYLITSLNGRSIYRIKFNDKFSKILYSEKIFIGERIRDIKFNKKFNSFVLALEGSGSLGILQSPQSKNISIK